MSTATSNRLGEVEERLQRLDARVKQAPGQMGFDLSAPAKGSGGGQKCGDGWIAPTDTCHKEGGGTPEPDKKPAYRPTPQVKQAIGPKPMTFNVGGDSTFDPTEEKKKAAGGLKYYRTNRGGPKYNYFFRDRQAAEHWYADDIAQSDADAVVGGNRRAKEWQLEYRASYEDTRNVLRDSPDRELLETIQAFAESGKASSRGSAVDVRIGGNEFSRPIREGTFASTQEVTSSKQQAAFARQQQQAAKEAGDERGAQAWKQEERTVERTRVQAAIERQGQSQQNLFGVTEYDETMPLFRQRRDSTDEVSGLIASILSDSLPDAQVLDWAGQPRGVTAGRAVSEGLVYRFRLDADSVAYRPAWEGITERQWELRSDGFLAARSPHARMDFQKPKFQQQSTKRKCVKGYGCGSACIQMSKECRIQPKSAISKQRLLALQTLAKEGDPMAEQMARSVQEGRSAKASELREGRQVDQLKRLLADPKVAEMVRTGKVPTAEPTKPGKVRDVDPKEIEVDPERFQYKIGASASGEVGSLSGVQKWDPNLAGVISVWQDPADGKTYVVNGHNRLALAKRLGAEDVTVRYIDAKDAQEARGIGAMQNIAEGAGKEIDAAKFFRDTGITTEEEVKAKGLPLNSGKASRGLALSKLPDEMFQDVIQGNLKVGRAAIIGGSGLDQDKQREVYKVLKKNKNMTDGTLQEYVEQLEVSQRMQQEEIDLFGTNTKTVDTGLPRAELVNSLKGSLGREARLLGAVSKSQKAVRVLEEKGGNVINVEQSQKQAQEASSVLRTFNQLKNVTGPVKTALDQAAARVTAGENKAKVAAELREAVIQALEEELKALGLRKPVSNEAESMSMFDSADRIAAMEARLDVLRRKCTTGYACGSTCITVKKECRGENSAAISKERIKRLEQLSRGEISPKGIGAPKPAEAAAMAESLQSARGSRAKELIDQRKAVLESKTAQSKATKVTPRTETETMTEGGDYEFARKSSVQNAGEDLANSARHKRNAFRTIEEAEASGQVEKLMTRDSLLKNFPIDLVDGINERNVLGRLEAHYCLKAFPNLSANEVDDYIKGQERRRASGRTTRGGREMEEVDAKTVRKQFFDAFQSVRGFVEANKDMGATELRVALSKHISGLIGDYRKTIGQGYQRSYGDPYNPAANALVAMQGRLTKRGKTSVGGQLYEFARVLKAAQGGDFGTAQSALGRSVEAATKIMEGSTLAAAFGQEGSGKQRFSAADLYVAPARRTGGRSVGGSVEAATEQIVKRSGFRGLQYGNSVTDEERKHHVQKAAEALVDLADVLDVPDDAISLKGTLGLAIGARGKGTALAHYEPGMKVINLTRKKGVGTLAHEWGHALDNYAAGGARSGSFLSTNVGSPEKRAAMLRVVQAWETTGYLRQVYAAIRDKKKMGQMISDQYWLSREEMFARSFEGYVQLKLEKAGRENTYLTQATGDPLWPTRQQAEQMEPMFDALMGQIRKDDFPGGSRRDSREERIRRFAEWLAPKPSSTSLDALVDRVASIRLDRRCMRPDGTYYGTAGRCIKGKRAGARTAVAAKGQETQHGPAKPSPKKPLPAKSRSTAAARPKSLKSESSNDATAPAKQVRIESGAPMSKEQIERAFRGFDPSNITRESMQKVLENIYAERGFNAKPEVVQSEAALRKRQDTIKGDVSGEGHVFYRGLTDSAFVDQFMGKGDAGSVHYPGLGIYGNGTYIVGPRMDLKSSGLRAGVESAYKTARNYAQVSRKEVKANPKAGLDQMAAMSFRADAKILKIEGLDWRRPMEELQKQASAIAGFEIEDAGFAAAILGYDGYTFPVSKSLNYGVVLNRGALIVSPVDARS